MQQFQGLYGRRSGIGRQREEETYLESITSPYIFFHNMWNIITYISSISYVVSRPLFFCQRNHITTGIKAPLTAQPRPDIKAFDDLAHCTTSTNWSFDLAKTSLAATKSHQVLFEKHSVRRTSVRLLKVNSKLPCHIDNVNSTIKFGP